MLRHAGETFKLHHRCISSRDPRVVAGQCAAGALLRRAGRDPQHRESAVRCGAVAAAAGRQRPGTAARVPDAAPAGRAAPGVNSDASLRRAAAGEHFCAAVSRRACATATPAAESFGPWCWWVIILESTNAQSSAHVEPLSGGPSAPTATPGWASGDASTRHATSARGNATGTSSSVDRATSSSAANCVRCGRATGYPANILHTAATASSGRSTND